MELYETDLPIFGSPAKYKKGKRKDRKYFGRSTSRLARPKLAGAYTHYDSGAAIEVAAPK